MSRRAWLKQLRSDEDGQDLAEYALLFLLIVVVVIVAAVVLLGAQVNALWEQLMTGLPF